MTDREYVRRQGRVWVDTGLVTPDGRHILNSLRPTEMDSDWYVEPTLISKLDADEHASCVRIWGALS